MVELELELSTGRLGKATGGREDPVRADAIGSLIGMQVWEYDNPE